MSAFKIWCQGCKIKPVLQKKYFIIHVNDFLSFQQAENQVAASQQVWELLLYTSESPACRCRLGVFFLASFVT